jgi:hypothetical protein
MPNVRFRPGGPVGVHRGRKVVRGMDMNGKKKFLIIALLLVVAFSFFLGDFWSCTAYALEKAVAEKVLLHVLSKILAGITAVTFPF